MADREGNVLKVPGTGAVAEVKGDEILGSYARFTQKGLTLKQTASRVYKAGTLLKVSSTAKKYDGVVNAGGISGTVGILRKPVDVSTEDKLGNYVASGVVKLSKLCYADGTAVDSGDYDDVATALNGRIDAIHGYLIF
jgi:hypothetical protein